MENLNNAPEAAVTKNEPISGSGAPEGGDDSLNLDNFLEEPAQPRPGQPDAAKADDKADPEKREPDEFDALRPSKPEDGKEDGDQDGEKKDGEEKPADAADVDGVKLVLPKGVSADNPELKQFVALAKESKVAPEVTQKFVDLYVEKQRNLVGDLNASNVRFRETLNKRWIRENHSDPEFGGENYDRSCNYIQAALRKFIPKDELTATEEKDGRMGFLEFFDQANVRNNPHMFRLLARIGKHFSEADPMTSEAAAPKSDRSAAEVLFGDI